MWVGGSSRQGTTPEHCLDLALSAWVKLATWFPPMLNTYFLLADLPRAFLHITIRSLLYRRLHHITRPKGEMKSKLRMKSDEGKHGNTLFCYFCRFSFLAISTPFKYAFCKRDLRQSGKAKITLKNSKSKKFQSILELVTKFLLVLSVSKRRQTGPVTA